MLRIYYKLYFLCFFKKTLFKKKKDKDKVTFFWLHKLNMLFFKCCKYITYTIYNFIKNTFLSCFPNLFMVPWYEKYDFSLKKETSRILVRVGNI